MENRYLFRGKRIDTGEWVEGFYCKWLKGKRIVTYSEKETDCIITWMSNGGMSRYEVEPSTICQCTGIKDKNGKLIFENDILEGHLDDKYPEDVTRTKVIWDKNGWVTSEPGAVDREPLDDFDTEYFEVVGNTIDNLNLLEV